MVPPATLERPTPVAGGAQVGVLLQFDNGQVIRLARTVVVVGRNPVARESDAGPQLVALDDPGHSVSKTHFACGDDERGVWVEDRNSTNGTSVTDRRGRRATLTPGRRTRVAVDVTITFGDRHVVLTLDP